MNKIEFLNQESLNLENKTIEVADKIWGFAETLYFELQSSEALKTYLKEEGFQVEDQVAGIPTAFKATYGSGKPVIGILAEYDALSGLSQEANVAKKQAITEGGNGHGCGHNLLGGGCVLAGALIKKYLEENKCEGTVIVFGCPAEEGGSGKTFMAREGMFDYLDCAFTWHPGDANIIVPLSTAANVQVDYFFKGTAAHAGTSPHLGRSALDAVELMNVGCNYLREHIIQEAKLNYAITDTGGFSPNVVQANASVTYLIRAPKIEQVLSIRERVDNVAKGAALMTGTEVDIHFRKACSHFLPNNTIGSVFFKSAMELGIPSNSKEEIEFAKAIRETIPNKEEAIASTKGLALKLAPTPELKAKVMEAFNADINPYFIPSVKLNMGIGGSSDVGDVSLNCPTAWLQTACWANATPGHSWQAVAQGKSDLAHKGMIYAAKILALSAINIYEDKQILENAWNEFKMDRNGQTYVCPIPKDTLPPFPNK